MHSVSNCIISFIGITPPSERTGFQVNKLASFYRTQVHPPLIHSFRGDLQRIFQCECEPNISIRLCVVSVDFLRWIFVECCQLLINTFVLPGEHHSILCCLADHTSQQQFATAQRIVPEGQRPLQSVSLFVLLVANLHVRSVWRASLHFMLINRSYFIATVCNVHERLCHKDQFYS